METMLPVVLRGNAAWPTPALPVEEFTARVARVQQELTATPLGAVLVYGNHRDYASLAYLTGHIPMTGGALALLGRTGPPRLYAQAPERNLPNIARLTWIGDVRSASRLADDLTREGVDAAPIGLVGEAIRSQLWRRLTAIDDVIGLSRSDDPVTRVRRELRPRERQILREAGRLTTEAADRVEQELAAGARPAEALLAAEYHARERGAHGVRALFSPDGGRTLQPFLAVEQARSNPFAFYLAVDLSGYWSETLRTVGAVGEGARALVSVRGALEAATSEVRVGASAPDVAQRLREAVGPREHPALSGRWFTRLDLARDDRVVERREPIDPGFYSLRLGVLVPGGGVLASTLIELDDGSAEALA